MQLVATFALFGLIAVPSAQGTGVLAGRVLPGGDTTIIPKTVWVGTLPIAVAQDGSFRAAAVPAGPSEVAIETSEGLFVVATPVTIAPGVTRHVQLAVGGRQDSAPQPAEKEKKKKRGGLWARPGAATLIIIGSAIIVGFAVDELTKSETPVSPASQSAPTN